MFQKLYNHLEQINANTRQHELSAQLEELNTSLLALDNRLLALGNHISALSKPQPQRNRGVQVVSFSLAGLALILLGILSVYTIRLSAAAAVAEDRSAASLQAYGR